MNTMKLEADRIANRLRNLGKPFSIERVRDACDQATAGDLDCTQLDILTDMVMARLKPPATPANAYSVALMTAAALLQDEARKHERAQADLEAEGYDERCEEALLHATEAECLRRAAGRILDLGNPYTPRETPAVPAKPSPFLWMLAHPR